jgi:hypothetical protein
MRQRGILAHLTAVIDHMCDLVLPALGSGAGEQRTADPHSQVV